MECTNSNCHCKMQLQCTVIALCTSAPKIAHCTVIAHYTVHSRSEDCTLHLDASCTWCTCTAAACLRAHHHLTLPPHDEPHCPRCTAPALMPPLKLHPLLQLWTVTVNSAKCTLHCLHLHHMLRPLCDILGQKLHLCYWRITWCRKQELYVVFFGSF